MQTLANGSALLTQEQRRIGPIKMDNMCTQHIIDSFDLILIDFCVVDQEYKSLWMRLLNNYHTVMVLL